MACTFQLPAHSPALLHPFRKLPAISFLLGLFVFALQGPTAFSEPSRPNFILIFADDLGFGDLGCQGHPTIRTPNLDRLAAQGMRFTEFYTAASVCTPSRAGLLTGRLPVRTGMYGDKRRVLFPNSKGGLPATELSLAALLKTAGYRTLMVGKWHLGHRPEYSPLRHGFDSFFGLPYSNDMDRTADAPKGRAAMLEPKHEYWNVPLIRDTNIIERPANQSTLTRRYTEEAVKFLESQETAPFFLYFAHTFPHIPLFASEQFLGRSRRGLYGDTVEELDWSVGQLVKALREKGQETNTLVFFTSDNGPWLTEKQQGGSAGLLREGKGSTWEGGMRVPAIAWWPGHIPEGQIAPGMAATLDIYPTFASLAGAPVPSNLILDGFNLSPLLLGKAASPRQTTFFYRGSQLYAVRHGAYKAHFTSRSSYGPDAPQQHATPLLFNLDIDPSEQWNIASEHPQILADIQAAVLKHKDTLKVAPSQLD